MSLIEKQILYPEQYDSYRTWFIDSVCRKSIDTFTLPDHFEIEIDPASLDSFCTNAFNDYIEKYNVTACVVQFKSGVFECEYLGERKKMNNGIRITCLPYKPGNIKLKGHSGDHVMTITRIYEFIPKNEFSYMFNLTHPCIQPEYISFDGININVPLSG